MVYVIITGIVCGVYCKCMVYIIITEIMYGVCNNYWYSVWCIL